MFIDIHAHSIQEPVCPRPDGKQPISTPEQLIAIYDRMGIERSVLLPLLNPENTTIMQSNEEVLRMVKNFPGRFVPFCNLDPRAGGANWRSPIGDVLKYYRDKGCRGVGEVCANLPFLHPLVQHLFECVEALDMALTFHISPFSGYSYGLVDDAGLPQLEECLKRFPKLRFFGHSQTFWAEISANPSLSERMGYPAGPVTPGRIIELMRRYPNLYGDLSAGSGGNALLRDRAHAVKFLHEFQDRLFFGTDICAPVAVDEFEKTFKLRAFLLELRQSGEISAAVFQKIARENAVRVLGL